MKGRRKIKLGAVVVIAAAYLLLSSVVSWGDTTIYAYQAATTGALTIQTIDCNGKTTNPVLQTVPIPNSCSTPDLFWDSTAGALRLNGFDSTKNPSWTGTIDVNGHFTTTMTLPTVTCTSAPNSVVSAAFPDTTLLPYSQACTGWSYGVWTPDPCAAGSVQTRTVAGIPAGCVGGYPDQPTVQSCPAPTCTTFTYSCASGSTCSTSGTCPAVVLTSYPAGCIGGAPLTTTTCTPGVACTDYTYSAWGTCTNGSQSRTVTGYTPTGCTGTPATSSVLTQSCNTTTTGFTAITFNAGTQSKLDTLTPGQTKYYTYTVPAGYTSFSMNISLTTQIANLDMVLVQSSTAPATTSLDSYLNDLAAIYTANPILWGQSVYKNYPPSAWATLNTGFGGEGIYLSQSTRVPPISASGVAASIPGTYYVIVKNKSTTATASYYVYVKQ